MATIEVMGDRASVEAPGHLAQAIVDYGQGFNEFQVRDVREPKDADFLVYCRRTADTLGAAVSFCHERGTPLALLSSGLDTSRITARRFSFINVSNASLPVVSFLVDVEAAAQRYDGWPVRIIEHHQPAKKDVSGTAKKLAGMLGVSEAQITSVRDWESSRLEHGIPFESQGGYAIHDVIFTDPSTDVDIEPFHVAVMGRETYAKGIMILAGTVLGNPENFPAARYDIVDLVKEHVL